MRRGAEANAECGVRNAESQGRVDPRDCSSNSPPVFRIPRSALLATLAVALPSAASTQAIPPLPDSTGWGVHVLALARGPDSAIWVGTYGQGIFVLRPTARTWERIRSSNDTSAHSISWDFVHAFAFGPRGQICDGTAWNGWGLSIDGGKTWKNWEFRQLG